MNGRTVAVVGATVGILAALVAMLAVVSGRADARATPSVAVQMFQFQPGVLDVEPGTEVRWTNGDDIEHTVTAGAPERPSRRFDLRLRGTGASATATFTEPGVHHYFCERHPSMRGEIRVNRSNQGGSEP